MEFFNPHETARSSEEGFVVAAVFYKEIQVAEIFAEFLNFCRVEKDPIMLCQNQKQSISLEVFGVAVLLSD